MSEPENLEELMALMLANDPSVLDANGNWDSYQVTFGGNEPADTIGVWSWDEYRLLTGTCADDLGIVER